MVKIKMITDANMKFFDPSTKKIQWYSTDMFNGNTMEFKDIDRATNENVFFICLDEEIASLPIKSFLISAYVQPQ